MYILVDVVEIGAAHELILSEMKDEFVVDDSEPVSFSFNEAFDPCN